MSIDAANVRKSFGRFTALAGVDLHVGRGKLVALLGPSGSGKTTLLRIIAGLEFPDHDDTRIHFHDTDVTELPPGRRGVGFVFQHYALFRHMSVSDNVAFGLRVRRRRDRPSRTKMQERVDELLRLVQLDGLQTRFPAQLSGGQRQRVALARALAVQPKVLLLDEPFGALDAKVRKELRRWLRKFHEETQLTTLFVTHDQEEALEIADEVVIMNQGRVEQVGTPQDVYDRPATPFVYSFLGNVNVLAAQALSHAGVQPDRPGTLQANGQVYVRPHDIEVLPHRDGEPGIVAVVRYIHAAGPLVRLTLEHVQTHDTVEVEISRFELTTLNLKLGDLANLRLRQGHSFGEDYTI